MQGTSTRHLNARLRKRCTPQVPAHHPHQTTPLIAPVNGTRVRIHSAPNGTPNRQLPALNPDEANTVQQVFGSFLYYSRAVNPTMIFSLNTIAYQQLKSTQETAKKVVQLLKYAATHPGEITRYYSRVMTLHIHSNALFFIVARGEIQIRVV